MVLIVSVKRHGVEEGMGVPFRVSEKDIINLRIEIPCFFDLLVSCFPVDARCQELTARLTA
jgi:hypothetical protein